MYRAIILFISILIISACTSNTIYKKPDDLIPKKQMVNLLVDMYLANAASGIKNKNLEKKINYMPLIYEKYGIDSLRFQRSNTYYISRADLYESIYKKVETRLKKMLDTTLASQKIQDSLRIAKLKTAKKTVTKELKNFPKDKKPKSLIREQK